MVFVFILAVMLSLDMAFPGKYGMFFASQAEAIIGAPITPLSYAGVARRTTRRAVVATSSAESASAAATAPTRSPAPPAGTATSAAPPASQTYSAVPTGTIVTALPKGCQTVVVGGATYYDCAGTFYKSAFEGDNLVYVVVERPVQ